MLRTRSAPLLLALGTATAAAPTAAQQVADSAYAPPIARPTWAEGAGPLVLIDEAHHDFHTAGGRFYPFARLLRRDGYTVEPIAQPFSAATLEPAGVLVISNPLAERNADGEWALPTPSAFTAAEIDAVQAWVRAGGSLLLIADHMPFPGAAGELARRFGFEFRNGFAMREGAPGPFVFRAADGSLAASPIIAGRGPVDRVDSVASFTGSAFRALDDDVVPILVLAPDVVSLEPDTAWQFHESTPRTPVGGWLQGAAREFGAGRVAVFGEAAMFSAQLGGARRQPMGMNAPVAAQNHRLVLDVLRWLTAGR